MERTVMIQPRDPAIFRDGKPFTLGLPARSTAWPMPSAVVGAIRTRLGRLTEYDPATVERLKLIEHFGPFLAARKDGKHTLAFAAPADAVSFGTQDGRLELHPLRPERLAAHEGTDLPTGLWPVTGGREEKPAEIPPFWSAAATMEWLQLAGVMPIWRTAAALGFHGLQRQRRTHLEIESGTQTAKHGMLFATEGLEFPDHERVRKQEEWEFEELAPRICSRISYDHREKWAALPSLAALGGERRLAYWWEESIEWPAPPEALSNATLVKLQLVTPGSFADGWKPRWLDKGVHPELPGLRLVLVAAAVPRAAALSGWDFTKRGGQSQKATRFLAPAGTVYFCEVIQGDPRQLWMRSIADDEQDRRDGFGLVLCGGWRWQ